MVFTESPLNLVRGPAKKSGWAQLVRLGGDRVAILFDQLRKAVGRIDGVFERLYYSEQERRWVVQYQVGGNELFTVRISPGLLEAGMVLSPPESEPLLASRKLGGAIKDTIRAAAGQLGSRFIRFPLKDRRTVCSFANLVKVKSKIASNRCRSDL